MQSHENTASTLHYQIISRLLNDNSPTRKPRRTTNADTLDYVVQVLITNALTLSCPPKPFRLSMIRSVCVILSMTTMFEQQVRLFPFNSSLALCYAHHVWYETRNFLSLCLFVFHQLSAITRELHLWFSNLFSGLFPHSSLLLSRRYFPSIRVGVVNGYIGA